MFAWIKYDDDDDDDGGSGLDELTALQWGPRSRRYRQTAISTIDYNTTGYADALSKNAARSQVMWMWFSDEWC